MSPDNYYSFIKRRGMMITLKPEEIERMCRELDSYYRDAEQALSANQIKTHSDAAGLASTISEANAILLAVLHDEREQYANKERVAKMENLSIIGATLHGRVQKLSLSLGQ